MEVHHHLLHLEMVRTQQVHRLVLLVVGLIQVLEMVTAEMVTGIMGTETETVGMARVGVEMVVAMVGAPHYHRLTKTVLRMYGFLDDFCKKLLAEGFLKEPLGKRGIAW